MKFKRKDSLFSLLLRNFVHRKTRIMKDFNTYIFDLDGTLLSSLEDLAASTNYALRWAGMPERTLEEVRMLVMELNF